MSPRKIYGYNLSNSKFLSSLSAARSLTIDEIPSGRFFNLNRGVTDKIRICLSVASIGRRRDGMALWGSIGSPVLVFSLL